MFDSWKFSKGNYLTLGLTVLSLLLVVGYAQSQHRSSEILTGVIGGLTIILGMITAEWLRSAREQVELTRKRLQDLSSHFERFLYNFDEYMEDQFSHTRSQHVDDFMHVVNSLSLLSETTRWPQPNAVKIRKLATEVIAKIRALREDADENGYIWSLEERMILAAYLPRFFPLVWDRRQEQQDQMVERVLAYRKTPPKEGIPNMYMRKRSK